MKPRTRAEMRAEIGWLQVTFRMYRVACAEAIELLESGLALEAANRLRVACGIQVTVTRRRPAPARSKRPGGDAA